MRARRLLAALLLAAACLGLGGCWDHKELEEVGFILALGLDPAPGNQLVVTALIAVPGKLAGGKGGSEGAGGGDQPHILSAVQAPDIASSLTLMQAYVGRRTSLLHCKAVIVGEALARQGLAGPVNELLRFRQARRTMSMITARGKAMEFLRVIKPNIERDPTRFLEMMILGNRFTALLPETVQLHDFAAHLISHGTDPVTYVAQLHKDAGSTKKAEAGKGGEAEDGGAAANPGNTAQPGKAPPLPFPQFLPGQVPRRGAATVDMIGAAVFRRDRLIGMLTGQEARLMLMLKGKYYRSVFSLQDPTQNGQWVSLDLRRARPPRIRVARSGQQYQVTTRVDLEAELVSQSGETDFTRPENRARLEDALGREVAGQALALQRKAQRWQADIFDYSDKARHLFTTWTDWLNSNWRARWPQAQLDTTARVQIRRYGMQNEPLILS